MKYIHLSIDILMNFATKENNLKQLTLYITIIIQVEHSVNLLRGKIYEAMDNRNLAVDCFREALRQDVYCFEAFDMMVHHHMLSAQEGINVLCKWLSSISLFLNITS